MAVYKVPQDVEAEDKLLGPFSFRQFIYLVVAVGGIALAWVLGNLLLPLAVIPLPIIVFFGALALPLRKDQPMETYLAAIVSFYLKPHKRLWDPDGQQELVEITAARTFEGPRTKDLSQMEAERRFSYLAGIVDTQGWAVRGVAAPGEMQMNTALNTDVYIEAQQTEDVLDASAHTAHNIETQLAQADERRRQEAIERMQHPKKASEPAWSPLPPPQNPYESMRGTPETGATLPEPHLTLNPYPSMHQSVIQPISPDLVPKKAKKGPKAKTPSAAAPSPDIINLANNPDLSVETIAHEANRIKRKGLPDDEVVVSLH